MLRATVLPALIAAVGLTATPIDHLAAACGGSKSVPAPSHAPAAIAKVTPINEVDQAQVGAHFRLSGAWNTTDENLVEATQFAEFVAGADYAGFKMAEAYATGVTVHGAPVATLVDAHGNELLTLAGEGKDLEMLKATARYFDRVMGAVPKRLERRIATARRELSRATGDHDDALAVLRTVAAYEGYPEVSASARDLLAVHDPEAAEADDVAAVD